MVLVHHRHCRTDAGSIHPAVAHHAAECCRAHRRRSNRPVGLVHGCRKLFMHRAGDTLNLDGWIRRLYRCEFLVRGSLGSSS